MNRVWAFAANASLVFGGLSMAVETVLGHNPVTIMVRASISILAAGLAGFFFRWLLEHWIQAVQAKAQAEGNPEIVKTNAAAAKSAVKVGR
ncbi:MAG: hypothetical protein HGA76_00170 [Candidatus Firestonebacteria bacterium]|nr:hypothetical protein [Candidatus Firestonebacteria bacterium]